MEYVFIGLGGILGALSRYSISKWGNRRWQHDFPLATFLVNIAGSFCLGLLYIIFLNWKYHPLYLQSMLTTGFFGALTTYSTFSFELINLIENNKKATAILYLTTSVILGLFFAYTGMQIGKLL